MKYSSYSTQKRFSLNATVFSRTEPQYCYISTVQLVHQVEEYSVRTEKVQVFTLLHMTVYVNEDNINRAFT